MFVALVGCDGTGKTAAVAALSARFRTQGRKVQVMDTWAINNPALYPECRFLDFDTKLIKQCGNEMASPERAMFLFWIIAQTARLAKAVGSDELLIADGYWAKHVANEVVRGFPEAIAMSIVQLLPRPDLTFLLRVPVDIALQRKNFNVTRFECGTEADPSPEAFVEFQMRLQSKMDQWGAEQRWIKVDASRDSQRVHAAMVDCISDAGGRPAIDSGL